MVFGNFRPYCDISAQYTVVKQRDGRSSVMLRSLDG